MLKIIEDDNRSGNIALVVGPLKQRWVLATAEMKVGDFIVNSAKFNPAGLTYVCCF